jgi:hypothetical protein
MTMKTREGSAPDLASAIRGGERPRTDEFDAADVDVDVDDADVDDADPYDARPRPISEAMQTAEIDIKRDRRATLTSPIPEKLAKSMVPPPTPAPQPRDPAAPEPGRVERTRRVGASSPVRAGSGLAPKSDADVAPWRQRAAQRIDEARAALDAGDLTAAVTAAEAALREADAAPAPGIVEVIEPARPLLTQVFTAYVGPPSGLPVLAPRANEIARQRLGERERALLGRVDGSRTLEELFDGSGLGSTDALRIVARLIRAGAVRVV